MPEPADITVGQLLMTLSQLPFLSADEISTLIDFDAREVRADLKVAQCNRLVGSVQYRRSPSVTLRRWYLTREGTLIAAREERTTPERHLSRNPVSTEWQRSLLRRLDAVDVLYRMLHEMVQFTGDTPEWAWHRDGPFDAAVRFPDGRRFVVMRLGSTLSWQATKSRLGSLYEGQNQRNAPIALVIVPGDIEKRRITTLLKHRAIYMHIAAESVLSERGMNAPTWEPVGTELRDITLEAILRRSRRRGRIPARPRHYNDRLPSQDIHENITSVNFLASELRPAERQMLRLLYDWPLGRSEELARILDVSIDSLYQKQASLLRRNLIHKVEIGESYRERRENGTRLVLTEDGRRALAWTDRRDLSDLTRHWQLTASGEDDPNPKMKVKVRGFRVDGTKLRPLISQLRHTDAVSEITAMLTVESRTHSNYRLVQAVPPHRWERVFWFNGRRAQISPDATYMLEYQGETEVNFLEYEERADRPSRMRSKIRGHESYFGAFETEGDFDDVLPRALFVFRNVETASRFGVFLMNEGTARMPLVVSSMDVLRREGFFGNSWTWPWEQQRGPVPLSALRRSR